MLKKRFTQISFCLVMLGMATGLVFAADIPDERRIRRLELVCRPAGEDIADLRAAQLYIARIKELGLDVKINPMPFTSEVDYVWRQRDRWDLTNWRLTGRPERSDPDELLYNGFHSSLIKAGFNFYGYVNQEVDKLLEAQRKELDVEKRKNLVWKVTEAIAKDMPIAPVVALHESFAYNKKLFDENSIINQAGIGIRNYWTFTNIKPLTGMKTLIVNYPTEIRALSPFSQGGVTDQWVAQLLFDRLMRIGPDSLPKPSVAEKVAWLDDITLEVMVRKGMKFHDGQPVTAHDVVFSYELVMAGEAPEYEAYTKSIDRVELIDDYKLIFHLKKPNAAFLFSTLGKIWIGPKHIWEPIYKEIKANPTDDATSIHLKDPIGSGPMKFIAWRRGEEVILEAVDNHHREAKVEKIVFRKVSIPEIIIGQLERGELNFVAAYLGDPRLLEKVVEKNKDLGWQACSTLGNRFFAYNLRRAPLNDVAFRRALAQVIPYEEIRQTVGLGYPIRSNSLINATLKYWFNPNIQMLSYDLEKAKSILKEAGYEWDEDGRLCYPQGQVESLPPAWGP